MPPTEYAPTGYSLRWRLGGCLAFVVCGVLMVLFPHAFERRFIPASDVVVVGCVAILLFGAFGWQYVKRLRNPGPELIASDEGLTHRLWGHVSWAEVEELKVRHLDIGRNRQRFIEVILKDPRSAISRMSPFARFWGHLNRRNDFSPYTIAESGFPSPFEDVFLELRWRHQQYLQARPDTAV